MKNLLLGLLTSAALVIPQTAALSEGVAIHGCQIPQALDASGSNIEGIISGEIILSQHTVIAGAVQHGDTIDITVPLSINNWWTPLTPTCKDALASGTLTSDIIVELQPGPYKFQSGTSLEVIPNTSTITALTDGTATYHVTIVVWSDTAELQEFNQLLSFELVPKFLTGVIQSHDQTYDLQ